MFDSISEKFTGIIRSLTGKSKISEKNIADAIEEIKNALLDADVNIRVVRRFVNQTAEEAAGTKVLSSVDPGQQFIKIVYDKMVGVLGGEGSQRLELRGPDVVSVILMEGLQGSGKTTTAAKLALRLRKDGRKVLLAACDVVRPAAVQQLKVLGESVSTEVFSEDIKDPVRIAKDALVHAKVNHFDTLIVDTSGRMFLDEALMDELKRISDAVQPTEKLFVSDAMTGQNAVSIAKEFNDKIGITGVVLSKFDSDTRGGAAMSIMSVVGVPVKLIGTGEKPGDLEVFYPERMASRILGMGDVVSLVEKAQEQYDEKQAQRLQEKIEKRTYDLQDYLEQLESMTRMGGVDKLLEMIPGAKGQVSEEDMHLDELRIEKYIIQSMTRDERRNFSIIGPTRRKRIAKGSGTYPSDVNRLLKKFEKLRLQMSKFSRNKKYQAAMMKQMGM